MLDWNKDENTGHEIAEGNHGVRFDIWCDKGWNLAVINMHGEFLRGYSIEPLGAADGTYLPKAYILDAAESVNDTITDAVNGPQSGLGWELVRDKAQDEKVA